MQEALGVTYQFFTAGMLKFKLESEPLSTHPFALIEASIAAFVIRGFRIPPNRTFSVLWYDSNCVAGSGKVDGLYPKSSCVGAFGTFVNQP